MPRFRIYFEDGHDELVQANEVQYAGGGVIVQQRDVTESEQEQLNPQTYRMERVRVQSVSIQLRAVLAPPRADMHPSRRWWRIESVPDELEPAAQSNGVPALKPVEVV